jgi:hypothetical protein
VHCVSGPRLDGGLTLQLGAPASGWCLDQLAHLGPVGDQVPLDLPEGEVLAVRARRVAERIEIESVTESGTSIALRRAGPESGGDRVILRLGAETLWTDEVQVAMRRWIQVASYLAGLPRCPDLDSAASLGWRVTKLDICADLSAPAYPLRSEDHLQFWCAGRRVPMPAEPSLRGGVLTSIHRRAHGGRNGAALSMSVQHKSEIVREVDRCEPHESRYAPAWRAGGWDGTATITRVEFRVRADALHRAGGLDLRDPRALTPENISAAFNDALTRYELRAGDGTTDPRWTAVREAVRWAPTDLGASVREPRPLTAPARLRRAEGRVLGGLAELVAGAPGSTLDDVRVSLRQALDNLPDERIASAMARRRTS